MMICPDCGNEMHFIYRDGDANKVPIAIKCDQCGHMLQHGMVSVLILVDRLFERMEKRMDDFSAFHQRIVNGDDKRIPAGSQVYIDKETGKAHRINADDDRPVDES